MDRALFQAEVSYQEAYRSYGKAVASRNRILKTKPLDRRALDDVSSELDRDRNRHLFGFLKGLGGQVFITTTHNDHIPIEGDRVDFFVENGSIAVN